MALLHLDGCDTYSALADAAARYAGSVTAGMSISTTGGRFGGGCVSPGSQSGTAPSYLGPAVFPHTGSNAIIVGGALLPATSSIVGSVLALWNSTSGTSGTELLLYYSGGFLHLYRGHQTTLLATASVGATAGVWHHMEVKATCADSGGTFEVRLNGVTVINFTGDTRQSTTGTPGFDRVYFCSPGGSLTQGAWDDMYVLDTSGTVANNWLGDCRVNTLAPTSDAAVQFTRSTGASNYLTIDEGRQNGDTDYVESSTVGHTDRYGYGDLAAAVSTVHGVQAITWCRKTDVASRTMRNKIVSGATTSDGATYALTVGYSPYVTTLSTDPATSAAWNPSAVNAITAGFEVIS